jgi:hypothetical protein
MILLSLHWTPLLEPLSVLLCRTHCFPAPAILQYKLNTEQIHFICYDYTFVMNIISL